MPIPPSDVQSAPTRADLLAAIQALNTQLATLTAAVLNNQTAIADIAARLTDAGLEAEPSIFAEILEAARTD